MAIFLLVVASIVILPFLTYYVTSTLFFRKSNSTAASKEPPTIPYFIPGVFHAAVFAHTGARKYFAELIKDYGEFSPFKVRAGPRSYVVLRDPTHVRRVLNAPEHFTTRTSKAEALDKLFGLPKNKERQSRTIQKAENGLALNQGPLSIPDLALAATTEAYISVLSANMHNKMFQSDTWTSIEDLWSFLRLVLLRCTSDTLFGSTLLKKYPGLVRDYGNFEAATEGFLHGMPSLMISGASKPRLRIQQGLRSWMKTTRWANNEESDSATNVNEAAWDEAQGLNFIRKHCHAGEINSDQEVNINTRVAHVLSIIHSTNTELVSSTFWTLVETLRKSHLSRNITSVMHEHMSPITHKYDITALSQEPLVESLQTEIRRLRTATCAIRTNETNGFPLDKHWSLRKGATVAIFSHDLALNADVWKRIQPRALDRPLGEFWAERFMMAERKNKSRKRDVAPGDTNAEDLGAIIKELTKSDLYPGSQFISTLQMATVAVLFAEFEIQLCDDEQVDAALPSVGEFAFGTVKPSERVAVRIRKRRT